MQYYAMDTASSFNMRSQQQKQQATTESVRTTLANDGAFIDFSINPDTLPPGQSRNPPLENFFWYNMVGDHAFVGFSGAHPFAETLPYFKQACLWLNDNVDNINVAFVVGHWNSADDGCEGAMTVPAVYKEISVLPGCLGLGSKLKFLMGTYWT
jgi:hypothetical protein